MVGSFSGDLKLDKWYSLSAGSNVIELRDLYLTCEIKSRVMECSDRLSASLLGGCHCF